MPIVPQIHLQLEHLSDAAIFRLAQVSALAHASLGHLTERVCEFLEAHTGRGPSTSLRTGSSAGGLGYEGKSRFLTVELFGRANVESVARPGLRTQGLKPVF